MAKTTKNTINTITYNELISIDELRRHDHPGEEGDMNKYLTVPVMGTKVNLECLAHWENKLHNSITVFGKTENGKFIGLCSDPNAILNFYLIDEADALKKVYNSFEVSMGTSCLPIGNEASDVISELTKLVEGEN